MNYDKQLGAVNVLFAVLVACIATSLFVVGWRVSDSRRWSNHVFDRDQATVSAPGDTGPSQTRDLTPLQIPRCGKEQFDAELEITVRINRRSCEGGGGGGIDVSRAVDFTVEAQRAKVGFADGDAPWYVMDSYEQLNADAIVMVASSQHDGPTPTPELPSLVGIVRSTVRETSWFSLTYVAPVEQREAVKRLLLGPLPDIEER